MAPRDLDKRIRLPPAGTAFRRRLYTSMRLSDKGSFRRRFDAAQAVVIHGTLRARLTFPLGPVRLSCTTRLSDSRILAVRGILPACSNGKRAG